MKTLDRRTLLRGAGGAMLALPWLEAMLRPGVAMAATAPKRFVVFFSPNGTLADQWVTGSGTSFGLGPLLEPLAAHRNKLTVIQGLDRFFTIKGSAERDGDAHQQGMSHMLTSTLNQKSATGAIGFSTGISIDQLIANHVGTSTRFKSVTTGVMCGAANTWSRMCFSGPGTPVNPEEDPQRLFDTLFADLEVDPAVLVAARARKQSILDLVKADLQSLRTQLGTEDVRRLDVHVQAVRDTEERIQQTSDGVACVKPTAPSAVAASDPQRYEKLGRQQMDNIVRALACDLTRVASLQWSVSVSNLAFPWLGVTGGHHSLSHEADTNAAAQASLLTINRWYATQLAYLLTELDKVKEGSGTLLDNTVVLWVNELAKGNTHSWLDQSMLLAGGLSGSLRVGRALQFAGTVPEPNLYVTLANAMGVNIQTFGIDGFCTGALSGLT